MQKKLLFFISVCCLITLVSIIILSQESYVIDGDKVYIDDSNAYIEARPHTISGSKFVNFTLISKNYQGNVNILFGFDQFTRPTKADLFMPNGVNHSREFTCTGNKATWFNYTINPKHAWCWENASNIDDNGIQFYYKDQANILFNHSFESANLATKTIYWTETDNWLDIRNQFKSFDYSYDDKTKWYYLDSISILKNKEYVLRSYIDVPNIENYYSKYSVAVYPSSYGINIQQAITDGKLYYLDPWVNGKYKQRGALMTWANSTNVTSFYKTWNGTHYSVAKKAIDTTLVGYPFMAEMAKSPLIGKEEAVYAFIDNTVIRTKVMAQVWNGSQWIANNTMNITTHWGTGATLYRSIDVEYWNASHAMIVWFDNETIVTNDFNATAYAIWNGQTIKERWGANSTSNALDSSREHPVFQQELARNPTKDELMLVQGCATSRSSSTAGPVFAMLWNGTNWFGNTTILNGITGKQALSNFHPIDVEYDHNGNAMVVAGVAVVGRIVYKFYNSTSETWSTLENATDRSSGNPRFVELAVNPLNNDMVMIAINNNADVSLSYWNSSNSTWDTTYIVDGNSCAGYYCIDVVYQANGTAVAAWANATSLRVEYKSFNGRNWSSITNNAKDRTATERDLLMVNDPHSNEIVMMVTDSNNDVFTQVWNGSNWTKSNRLDALSVAYSRGFSAVYFGTNNAPEVTLINPTESANINVDSNISFICNGTDDFGLKNITLYHNLTGTWQKNSSIDVTGTKNSSTWDTYIMPAGGNYSWNCLIYDTDGFKDWSTNNGTFNGVVGADEIAPNVTLRSPVNGYSTDNNTITLNCTVDDNIALKNVTIKHNFKGVFEANRTKESITGTSFKANWTYELWSIGTFQWNCVTYDVAGNMATGPANFVITRQSSNAPTISIKSPANNSQYENGTSITFNCTCYDNNGCTNISLYHNLTGIWEKNRTKEVISGTSFKANWTYKFNFTMGTYQWGCLAYDSYGQPSRLKNGTYSQFCVVPENNYNLTKNVTFCHGTYVIDDKDYATAGKRGILLFNNSYVAIKCSDTTMISTDGNGYGAYITNWAFSNVSMEGCKFKGYDYGLYVYNSISKLTLYNNTFEKTGAVYIFGTDWHNITNNNFTGSDTYSVGFSSSSENNMIYNNFYNASQYGISTIGSNSIIEHNTFRNMGDNGVYSPGSGTRIESNSFTDMGGVSNYVIGGGTPSNVLIKNNSFENCAGGIDLSAQISAKVINNTLNNISQSLTYYSLIAGDNCQIENNTINGSKYVAIYINSKEDCSFIHNNITNSIIDIWLNGADNLPDYNHSFRSTYLSDGKKIYYNTSSDDLIFDGKTSNFSVISCINCENLIIRNTKPTRSSFGIMLIGSNNTRIINSTMNTNDLCAGTYCTGVYMLNTTNNSITNSTINSLNSIYTINSDLMNISHNIIIARNDAIYGYKSPNSSVYYNNISTNVSGDNMIDIGKDSHKWRIKHNNLTTAAVASYAINIDLSNKTNISNNNISSLTYGLYITNSYNTDVIDNVITSTTSTSYIDASPYTHISYNNITGVSYALYVVYYNHASLIEYNVINGPIMVQRSNYTNITDNEFLSGGSIAYTGNTGSMIRDNTFSYNADDNGIDITTSGLNLGRNTSIINNTLRKFTSTTTSFIYLDQVDYSRVINNTLEDGKGYGIRFVTNANNNNIINNRVVNTTYAMHLSSSKYNLIKNNIIDVSPKTQLALYLDINTNLNLFKYNMIGNANLSFNLYNGSLSFYQINITKSNPTDVINISSYINITSLGPDVYLFINVSYNDSILTDYAIDENTLSIWRFNETWDNASLRSGKNKYGVEIDKNYVFANLTRINGTYAPFGSAAVTDTCTIAAAGNHIVDCADACIWNAPQNVPANLYLTGTGIVRLSSRLKFTGTNQYILISPGCQLYIESGGSLN